jgi:NMD protein affecting ribosome stability and mRNA decay
MTAHHKIDPARQHAKDERAYGARNEDPYQSRGKYTEPSMCTSCGAVFHKGRWQWGVAQQGAHKHLCPACQRIHDHVPAGIITLSGEFFNEHRQEIMNLVHNTEAREKAGHPLQRIMNITMQEEATEISLTDFHVTRAIGEAIQHAYKGEVDYQYTDKDGVMTLRWAR